MTMDHLAKTANRKDISFGIKMLLYQQSSCPTGNVPVLLTSHNLPDNYHSLDKRADTVQPSCSYLHKATNVFYY